MNTVIPVPKPHFLHVASQKATFPVNRIFCVGRNYAAHAIEMGKDPDRNPPFFFMKPACAAVPADGAITISYPPKTSNFHHEIELVVAIKTGGKDISVENALNHVYGYAVGLDMTRRDLQLAARDAGRPWEFGKSFPESAPIGAIHTVADVGHLEYGKIEIAVNEEVRQSSDISRLIWSVAECISYLSSFDELAPGDLIMTGTPEGVAAVVPGDEMKCQIDGIGDIVVRVAK